VNGGEVDGNEPVGLEHAKKFIEKPIWPVVHKVQEIIDVFKVEASWSTRETSITSNYVPCLAPELHDSPKCAFCEAYTTHNLSDSKQVALIEIYSCKLDVVTDFTIWHGGYG